MRTLTVALTTLVSTALLMATPAAGQVALPDNVLPDGLVPDADLPDPAVSPDAVIAELLGGALPEAGVPDAGVPGVEAPTVPEVAPPAVGPTVVDAGDTLNSLGLSDLAGPLVIDPVGLLPDLSVAPDAPDAPDTPGLEALPNTGASPGLPSGDPDLTLLPDPASLGLGMPDL